MSRRVAVCAFVASVLVAHVAAVYEIGATDDDDDSNDSTYLWDLNVDPLESTSVYGESAYSTQQSELFSLLSTWQGLAASCDSQYTSQSLDEEVWAECGGVCPNVTVNNYKLDVSQIYTASNPPHIVFMLADDWGHNDVGFRSTYMSWTTPTIDSFVSEGITLENYFSHYYCAPSRAALMTGRHATRLGMIDESEGCELPLSEATMAQELKSAGYMTYMVGKWHLGDTSRARTPLNRGFDKFYGFYSGYIDYYTKEQEHGYLDLQDGYELETDASILDSEYHSAYLFQDKAEEYIQYHADNYPDTPMFLYYAIQLVHFPYSAPTTYTDRCIDKAVDSNEYYCGLNLMLDEVVANTTCVLSETGMLDNTVIVFVSDNGGNRLIQGNNYPYRGYKYEQFRGGLSANAFMFSPLFDTSLHGTSYYGQMHVTDWLPTLMNLATDGTWTGSIVGNDIDGVDMWDAIMTNSSSPRSVIVHYASADSSAGSIQKDMIKLDYLQTLPDVDEPDEYFYSDLHRDYAKYVCDVLTDVTFSKGALPVRDPDPPGPPLEDGNPRSTGLYTTVGSSISKQTETTAADTSVYASLKSTSDYLLWLVCAGILLSLLVVLSNHVLKRDSKYQPIDSSNLDLLVSDSPGVETGRTNPYQKSLI